MTEKQKQNEIVTEQSAQEQTQTNLNSILQELKKWDISDDKKEHIFNYVLQLSEIESKYQTQRENVKKEVRFFIEASFWDRLYTHLWEYNIKKFDVDWNNKIDSKEEENYSQSMSQALSQIILLWWLDKFSKIHKESDSKSGFSNADKWLASKVDLWNHILWEKWEKRFAESTLQKLWEISEEELHKMQEAKFQPTSKESWKELWLLLAKEFGDWVEDVLRFLTNIPSGVILLPRYAKYRVDINSSDELTKTTWEIKIKELTSENTSLVLLDLLWEQWVELIKKLWEMFTSWKQWDIAMLMVTIAWLVAGWAWAAKLWLNLARKSAVKSARTAWREARVAWKTSSRATRNSLKTVSWAVWNFARKASRVDDIVGWAGIGHLTWAYSWVTTEKIKKVQENSWISYEVVMENAKLWDTARLKKAQELVWNLSQKQKDKILYIHNHVSKWVYQNEFWDIKRMLEELDAVWFSRKQSRILMENGILWQHLNIWKITENITQIWETLDFKKIKEYKWIYFINEWNNIPHWKWKLVYLDWTIEEWNFLNWHLVKWKKTFDNSVREWDFDIENLWLLKNGTVIYHNNPDVIYSIENLQLTSIFDRKSWIIHKWNFTNPTSEYSVRKLYNWKLLRADDSLLLWEVKNWKLIISQTYDLQNTLSSQSVLVKKTLDVCINWLEWKIKLLKEGDNYEKLSIYYRINEDVTWFLEKYRKFIDSDSIDIEFLLYFKSELNRFLWNNIIWDMRNYLESDYHQWLSNLQNELEHLSLVLSDLTHLNN